MTVRAVALAGLGLWLALTPLRAQDAPARSPTEIMDILMWNREPVGGPFELFDHNGRTRTERDFRGRLMLVYFGFTYCPDVCPTDLQAIGLAMDKLGGDSADVQPLFVTVDPERDTPAHLAEYVKLFHPRLIGLTGSAEAIRRAADAYKVYYARVDLNKDGQLSRLLPARHLGRSHDRDHPAASRRAGAVIHFPSWPGSSRPSTSFLRRNQEDVDARQPATPRLRLLWCQSAEASAKAGTRPGMTS